MENCAKCGKELAWNEQKLVFWNKQLKKGYIKWMVIGPNFGKSRDLPEYKDKKLCQDCAIDVFETALVRISPVQITGDDFETLQRFLKESGVVMTAINCPKCDGMNDIPQTGKILICKHCGKPIKPKDIEEKVKELTK